MLLRYFISNFFFLLYFGSLALGAPAVPGIPEPEGKLIEFEALDATPQVKLRGKLSLPETKSPKPPVVMLIWGSTCDNGTGWVPGSETSTGRDEAIFLDIRNAFLRSGIAVFTYTKRGCSPQHGGTGDKTVLVTSTRRNRLADASAAYEELAKSDLVDSTKMFVLGHSEGNTYAWELGLAKGDRIRGLLLVSFISGRYIAAEYQQIVLRRMNAFALVDEDHSETISKGELQLYPCYLERDYLQFEKCDSDHDGVLSAMEFRSCRERRWLEFIHAVESTPSGKFVENSKDPVEWLRESYKAESMIETAGRQNVPVALFQGGADTATPPYEAVALWDTLTELQKPPYFFKIYPKLSHGLAIGSGRNGHCEKFGPVDGQVLQDLVAAVRKKLY